MHKQVIAIRSDLKLSRGKMAAQAAHAAVSSAALADKKAVKYWMNEGQKKVVLKARDTAAILALEKKCNELKIPSALVRDAGMTELKPGTITCIGIGPDKEEKINKVTGSLPLLK